MANSTMREKRKRELLMESAVLREQLAVEILTLIHTPNPLTKGINLFKKARSVGFKPMFAIAGLLIMGIIRPWRFFIGHKKKEKEVEEKGIFAILRQIIGYVIPIVRFALSSVPSGTLSSSFFSLFFSLPTFSGSFVFF